jgi:hypothetical protein
VNVVEVAVCGALILSAFAIGYLVGRRRPPRHRQQNWPPGRRR